MSNFTDSSLVDAVAKAYSQKARSGTDTSREPIFHLANKAARSVGYIPSDLESIPAAAQIAAGCGSPVHAANLKDVASLVDPCDILENNNLLQQGEIVVDLGSGGGIDIFLAEPKVGPHGQAIGIDVSADMIALARRNAMEKGLKPPHVTFIQASLAEPLPIASNTVDCVMSNCVINLLPHGKKEDALKEVYRILKPGGRLVLDDIVAKCPLSDEIRNDFTSYVNCISGSILAEEYKIFLETSGFTKITFLETGNDLQQICCGVSGSSCCSASTACEPKYDVNAWVASYQITAVKDDTSQECDEAKSTSVLLRWWDAYPKVKSEPGRIPIEELEVLMRASPTPRDFADMFAEAKTGMLKLSTTTCPYSLRNTRIRAVSFSTAAVRPGGVPDVRDGEMLLGVSCLARIETMPSPSRYQDYINDKAATSSAAYVLQGGIKSWLAKYGDQEDLVEPYRFATAPGQSDLDVARGLNARETLEHHWDNWIVEDDWAWMSERGLNAVRIPIGYYHLCGNDPSVLHGTAFHDLFSVYSGAWSRITKAIETANRYGLGVLIDLHAAPGKQNKDAHSGTSDPPTFFSSSRCREHTTRVLCTLVKSLNAHANSHQPPLANLIGIELLNEPAPPSDTGLQAWYMSTIKALREIDSTIPIYLGDCWRTDEYAEFVQTTASLSPLVLDHHLYRCFTASDNSTPVHEHIRVLSDPSAHTPEMFARITEKLGRAGGGFVVGEWSGGFNPDSLTGKPGEQSEYIRAQLALYEKCCAGWFFWTYKKQWEGDTGWSLRDSVGSGMFPDRVGLHRKREIMNDEERRRLKSDAEKDRALGKIPQLARTRCSPTGCILQEPTRAIGLSTPVNTNIRVSVTVS
ncbi:hypothetical protein C0995_004135 [Termitomyces sp. Mi166|nr:hypothetical protein C0995_004135 [Termitomyces sp. Mi166\